MSAVAPFLHGTTMPATSLAITPSPLTAGTVSDEIELDYWCERDNPGGAASGPISLYALVQQAADWLSSGLGLVDQAWLQVQVYGMDNTADPNMTPQLLR